MSDFLWRCALIAAHRVLRAVWFVTRPSVRGAHVVVLRDAQGDAGERELLLVRNSYKSGFTVPCGGVKRGETPRQAACRELAEEVGLVVDPRVLRDAGEIQLEYQHRRDHSHFFVLDLGMERGPALRVDRREVVWAGFEPIRVAETMDLVPHLRRFLAGAAAAR